MTETSEKQEFKESVDLKDPVIAAFLAWLLPGLGHLYQGRRGKACLFFVCVVGTFLYGLYLGSDTNPDNQRKLGWGRVVYFSWRQGDKRLPYLCQVGVGLPALPALVQANRMSGGKRVWWNGFMAPPRIASAAVNDPNFDQPTADELHKRLARYFELGTVYTMIAGLLNVLAIYDAWGGPVFGQTAKKDEEDAEDQDGHTKDAESNSPS